MLDSLRAPEARASERSIPGVWPHIKAACEHNADLSERVLWCAGVDWQRTLDKLAVGRPTDRFFHVLLCWEWWAVANYRFSYWVFHRSIPSLGRARFLQRLLLLQQAALVRFSYLTGKVFEALSGARLNASAEIGPGLLIVHSGSCGIGPGVRIGHTFTLYTDANVASRRGGDPPTIGDRVTLFSGARVVGPVRVGDNATIGANALVLHDLPPGTIAAGVPARPLSDLDGARPPHAPAPLFADLLSTLLLSGDLKEISPGLYLDTSTGQRISLTFPDSPDPGS